jgi:hypothetical protein
VTHGKALEVRQILRQAPRQAAICAYDSIRGYGGYQVDARLRRL